MNAQEIEPSPQWMRFINAKSQDLALAIVDLEDNFDNLTTAELKALTALVNESKRRYRQWKRGQHVTA